MRIPRSKGVTTKVIAINNEDNVEQRTKLLKALQSQVLHEYTQNHMNISGYTYSLSEVANHINTSEARVVKLLSQALKNIAPDNLEDIYRATLSRALFGISETRARISSHAERFERAQGDDYTPFVSGFYTNLLHAMVASDKSMIALAESLKSSTQINIQNNLNPPLSGEYLGTNEAIRMIDNHRELSLLEDTNKQQQLLKAYRIEDMPEVEATRQQGFSMDAQGASIKNRKKRHEDRRESDEDAIIIS